MKRAEDTCFCDFNQPVNAKLICLNEAINLALRAACAVAVHSKEARSQAPGAFYGR